MSRLAGGGLHRCALQPGLEVWPVFLQFLIVSGNCKELRERKGDCTECPRPPFAGVGGASWDQEMSRSRRNPEATGSYLVLVVGAQAVPGLRVVLSVPAVEREGGGGGGLGFPLGARTLELQGTSRVCAPAPARPLFRGGGGHFPETERGGGTLAGADK